MADPIRTEDELRQAVADSRSMSYDLVAFASDQLEATIRALWADLADADETAVLQSKAILDGEAERDRMKAVYDAAVKWRKGSVGSLKVLNDAVDAAEGKP